MRRNGKIDFKKRNYFKALVCLFLKINKAAASIKQTFY